MLHIPLFSYCQLSLFSLSKFSLNEPRLHLDHPTIVGKKTNRWKLSLFRHNVSNPVVNLRSTELPLAKVIYINACMCFCNKESTTKAELGNVKKPKAAFFGFKHWSAPLRCFCMNSVWPAGAYCFCMVQDHVQFIILTVNWLRMAPTCPSIDVPD